MKKNSETYEHDIDNEFGFVPTLNNMGYMIQKLDHFSQAYVDFVIEENLLVNESLEIGAAFGVASKEILKREGSCTINDIDQEHLKILFESLSKDQQQKVRLLPGDILSSVHIPPNSLKSVLSSRVFHFFTGDQLRKMFSKLWNWLQPGGRIYIVTETPYLGNLTKFIPIYEERKRQKDPFPGFIEDFPKFAISRTSHLPSFMNFLDVDVLSQLAKDAEFNIIRCHTFSRNEFPPDLRFDGRESVGLIAEKKRR